MKTSKASRRIRANEGAKLNLIKEVEIAYFRSFYKVTLYNCDDLNIIFGKNDAGKSNVVRALNLFFNNSPDRDSKYNFSIDFSDKRVRESQNSEDIRKFIYVKVTFNTPQNFQRSLGKNFYVKRQWTVSRGNEFFEEVSSSIRQNQRHIVTRFLNQIRFIYIPAIKDSSIFEGLLLDIYEALAKSTDFAESMDSFTKSVQNSTKDLFSQLPSDVAFETKISAPSRMDELFQTLDFETTIMEGDTSTRSLTLQRGDGIKARHIPELLSFISKRDKFQYHIWGFEEPENSLDFVAAEAEARRFLRISTDDPTQIFVTTHSPSFYNLPGDRVARFYVERIEDGSADIIQGKALERFDAAKAIGEGFLLPAVAKALEKFSEQQARMLEYEAKLEATKKELAAIETPVLLTEGKVDEIILKEAWKRLRRDSCPFVIKACDTDASDKRGGAGGVEKLAISLKSVRADNRHIVMGLFDRDSAGIKAWGLDRNFIVDSANPDVRRSTNGRSIAILLPTPDFRQNCATHENLPIEFMFRDEHLDLEVDGKKLKRRPMVIVRTMGSAQIQLPIPGGTEVSEIIADTKMAFATVVVPKLPDEAFNAFDSLFTLLESIVDVEAHANSNRPNASTVSGIG